MDFVVWWGNMSGLANIKQFVLINCHLPTMNTIYVATHEAKSFYSNKV